MTNFSCEWRLGLMGLLVAANAWAVDDNHSQIEPVDDGARLMSRFDYSEDTASQDSVLSTFVEDYVSNRDRFREITNIQIKRSFGSRSLERWDIAWDFYEFGCCSRF